MPTKIVQDQSESSSEPAWSKESIIALVTIFIMLFVFILGLLTRHRLKRVLAVCCGGRQHPTSGKGTKLNTDTVGSWLTTQADIEAAPILPLAMNNTYTGLLMNEQTQRGIRLFLVCDGL